MSTPGERFTFTFEALPDDVPPAIRVRQLLKQALRQHRLRCVKMLPEPADDAAKTPGDPAADKNPE